MDRVPLPPHVDYCANVISHRFSTYVCSLTFAEVPSSPSANSIFRSLTVYNIYVYIPHSLSRVKRTRYYISIRVRYTQIGGGRSQWSSFPNNEFRTGIEIRASRITKVHLYETIEIVPRVRRCDRFAPRSSYVESIVYFFGFHFILTMYKPSYLFNKKTQTYI